MVKTGRHLMKEGQLSLNVDQLLLNVCHEVLKEDPDSILSICLSLNPGHLSMKEGQLSLNVGQKALKGGPDSLLSIYLLLNPGQLSMKEGQLSLNVYQKTVTVSYLSMTISHTPIENIKAEGILKGYFFFLVFVYALSSIARQ